MTRDDLRMNVMRAHAKQFQGIRLADPDSTWAERFWHWLTDVRCPRMSSTTGQRCGCGYRWSRWGV